MASNKDNYEMVTEQVIDGLQKVEKGDWERPWPSSVGRPKNAYSERPYHGTNVLLLWMIQQGKGYRESRWITYKQAQRLGGYVERGEKASPVVFWNVVKKVVDSNGQEVDMDPSQVTDDDPYTVETVPYFNKWSVFNVEQCENLDLPEPEVELNDYDGFRRFVESIGADIEHCDSNPRYQRKRDRILCPPPSAFDCEEAYCTSIAHELVHWSGSPDRLDREKGSQFADSDYAYEELVAELGAAFLCADFGITSRLKSSTAYIRSWIELLESDDYAIIAASKAAKDAVHHLHESAKVKAMAS